MDAPHFRGKIRHDFCSSGFWKTMNHVCTSIVCCLLFATNGLDVWAEPPSPQITVADDSPVASQDTHVKGDGGLSLTSQKPNIVLIMADDLGYGDLGCYGQKLMSTPRIDQLAASGMRFTQAYAGAPVCTASRSVLMTGQHNGHTPARDNVPHYSTYFEEDDVTIAEVLQPAGYRCGGVGKWSLGDTGSVGRATHQGFDSWFGYLNQDHAHYYYPEYLDDDDGRLELTGNAVSREHYSHDLLTDRALQFIRESHASPFFLYVAWTLPHFAAKDEDPDGLTVPSTAPYSDRDWDERSKKYAAMINMLDSDVGRILDLLSELELEENTLVIFTSDHGGHWSVPKPLRTNGALRGYKRDLTEGGIRVPFIARWTGTISANQTNRDVIAFQDMLPTFAELADASPPQGIDGISIVDAMQGKKLDSTREFLYWDYGHCRARYDQAVRWKDWKGIRLGAGSDLQLYDLASDVSESHNIAANHPKIVRRIEAMMDGAVTPSERYPIGKRYRGGPLWTREK
ncbi:arylsulfatase [Rosistilla oblonga]|uniref:arylsulfatase n=1 Tax=Rosistilla oblonga TaxID=2527990 RepID=UPI003A984B66